VCSQKTHIRCKNICIAHLRALFDRMWQKISHWHSLKLLQVSFAKAWESYKKTIFCKKHLYCSPTSPVWSHVAKDVAKEPCLMWQKSHVWSHVAKPFTLTQLTMGWLRLVGSLKLQVSFAKEPYKKDDSAKETCCFKQPTHRSHPIVRSLLEKSVRTLVSHWHK